MSCATHCVHANTPPLSLPPPFISYWIYLSVSSDVSSLCSLQAQYNISLSNLCWSSHGHMNAAWSSELMEGQQIIVEIPHFVFESTTWYRYSSVKPTFNTFVTKTGKTKRYLMNRLLKLYSFFSPIHTRLVLSGGLWSFQSTGNNRLDWRNNSGAVDKKGLSRL